MSAFLFVGEKPSPTAQRKRWSWTDGRLAGASLAQALAACGLVMERQRFVNLFGNRAGNAERPTRRAVRVVRFDGAPVVAMGRKVSAALTRLGIAHRCIAHPAARGRIRKREVYAAHVRAALLESR